MPHVVMVSWKDIRHAQRGGAEVYTLTVLEGLSQQGYRATWLAPAVAGYPPEETTAHGVQIIRRGNRITHLLHAWHYLRIHRDMIDLVIDQFNAYPMLTCFFVPREKGLLLIHQLTRRVWFYELPLPLALFGYALEPLLLRLYRSWHAVTVSASTAHDLYKLGFRQVTVAKNALPFCLPPKAQRQRPDTPHYVSLGRLVRMKRFEHLLEAFKRVKQEEPEARLTIIGRGESRYAKQLAQHIDQMPGAQLLENASEETKREILGSATAVVATSVREGWGLMVTEGHAFGTPSIAYRIPGLKDSTWDGSDGLLTEANPRALARVMLELHREPQRWEAMSQNAYEHAAELTAVRLTNCFCGLIERHLQAPATEP